MHGTAAPRCRCRCPETLRRAARPEHPVRGAGMYFVQVSSAAGASVVPVVLVR